MEEIKHKIMTVMIPEELFIKLKILGVTKKSSIKLLVIEAIKNLLEKYGNNG